MRMKLLAQMRELLLSTLVNRLSLWWSVSTVVMVRMVMSAVQRSAQILWMRHVLARIRISPAMMSAVVMKRWMNYPMLLKLAPLVLPLNEKAWILAHILTILTAIYWIPVDDAKIHTGTSSTICVRWNGNVGRRRKIW